MDLGKYTRKLGTEALMPHILNLPLKEIGADTETEGFNSWLDKVVGFSIYIPEENTAYYFPVNHLNGVEHNIPPEVARNFLDELYHRIEVAWWYNMEFDTDFVEDYFDQNWDSKSKDAMAVVWNQDVNVRMPGLKDSMKKYFDYDMMTFDEVTGGAPFAYLDPSGEKALNYATDDAYAAHYLGHGFDGNKFVRPFITMMDMETVKVTRMMKRQGIPVDKENLDKRIASQKIIVDKLFSEIQIHAGFPIKPNSPAQVAQVMVRLGMADLLPRTEKGNLSTKKDVLAQHRDKHPFIRSLTDYRVASKNLKAYYEGMKRSLVGEKIHIKYFPYLVPTGRVSAGSEKEGKTYAATFGIQSSPKSKSHIWSCIDTTQVDAGKVIEMYPETSRQVLDWIMVPFAPDQVGEHFNCLAIEGVKPGGFREMFIPYEGEIYGHFDYGGEELRIAASLSHEPVWIQAFNEGKDIHEQVARRIFGDEYNMDLRKLIKILNFALLYGGTWFNVMKAINLSGIRIVTKEEAQDFVYKYERALPILYKWKAEEIAKAHRCGYIYTYFGRQRSLRRWLKSTNRREVAFGERSAINSQVQGTAGDILRIALNRLVRDKETFTKVNPRARMLSIVHDEINFSLRKETIIESITSIGSAMNFDIKGFPVQMKTSLELGTSWGNLFPFYFDGRKLIPETKGFDAAEAELSLNDLEIEEDLLAEEYA